MNIDKKVLNVILQKHWDLGQIGNWVLFLLITFSILLNLNNYEYWANMKWKLKKQHAVTKIMCL